MRTTTQLIGSGFATVALLLAGEATALPPPMTEQELLDAADLVIDGVGMSIECDGIPIAEGNSVVTSYVSQVFPTETHKGVQMRSVVVSGQTAEWIVPVAGGWYPRPIPVGWSGRLYLEENDDGSYSELWWNATEEDQASAPETLPDCNPASGGAGGMGGSGGDTGGSAGHVSGGSAGAATGGAGDTTGGSAGDTTGGSAGDVTGGAGSGGETTGAGGSSNQAGAATGPSEDSDDDSGCSCIAAGGTNPDSRLVVVLGFLLCAAGLGRGRSLRCL